MSGKPGRSGRRTIDPSGQWLKITSVKLTTEQQIAFRRLGGSAWLRRMIDAHDQCAPNGKVTPKPPP